MACLRRPGGSRGESCSRMVGPILRRPFVDSSLQLELPSRCHCHARAMSMRTKVRVPNCCLTRRPDDPAGGTGLAAAHDVHGNVAVSIRLAEGMVALLEGQLAWFPRLGVPLSPSPSSARMGQILAPPQRACWRNCSLIASGHFAVSPVPFLGVLDCRRCRLRCGCACDNRRTTSSDLE